MKIYLCGPISGMSDEVCNAWRDTVRAVYPDTVDPMRRDYRGVEADIYREIVELDKRDIDNCDVLLAYCYQPTWGTSMEIIYAWHSGIPVVSVSRQANRSPWLTYHSTIAVTTLDDALTAIGRIT